MAAYSTIWFKTLALGIGVCTRRHLERVLGLECNEELFNDDGSATANEFNFQDKIFLFLCVVLARIYMISMSMFFI
jgi:hypothetical protein